MRKAATVRDWVPLVVAMCALAAGLFGGFASMRATRVNAEANQIKWLEEARTQAASVRKDLDATSADLVSTNRNLAQANGRIAELGDLVEEMTRWTLRVVDWAHDDNVDGPELRRLINGGPPSMRASARRIQDGGRSAAGWSREEGQSPNERT
jgi:hypothetical protein